MFLTELKRLQNEKGYPCLSILLPTHRTRPDNERDPIVLKNLVTEARERLLQEYTKREADAVLKRLDALVAEIDHQQNHSGIALYVNEDLAKKVDLPFTVEPRVQIDESFAIRDLLFAYNRSPHYYALILSEKPTRLFLAFRDDLEEVDPEPDKFPMVHDGPGGRDRLPGGAGVNPSAVRDAHRREFLRRVDNALTAYMTAEPLPIVITGTEDFLADFPRITKHADDVIGMLGGNYDYMSAHDVGKTVWPVAQEGFALRRQKAMDRLGVAVGAGKYASGIVQVLGPAQEGRGALLLVEEGYHQPAILNGPFEKMTLVDDPADARAQDDAVDLVIQEVVAKGGQVVFAEPGSLKDHQRIALVLRY